MAFNLRHWLFGGAKGRARATRGDHELGPAYEAMQARIAHHREEEKERLARSGNVDGLYDRFGRAEAARAAQLHQAPRRNAAEPPRKYGSALYAAARRQGTRGDKIWRGLFGHDPVKDVRRLAKRAESGGSEMDMQDHIDAVARRHGAGQQARIPGAVGPRTPRGDKKRRTQAKR